MCRRQLGHSLIDRDKHLGVELLGLTLGQDLANQALVPGPRVVAAFGAEVDAMAVDVDPGLASRPRS
jgi:hypothetical protein